MILRFLHYFMVLWFCVQAAIAGPLEEHYEPFDVKQANQQFDRINLKLSVQNLNFDNLNAAVKILSKLLTQADQCVDETQKKLNNLELILKQTTHALDANKAGADLVYLNQEQKKIATRQSQCRLFSIRAKEAINAYQAAIAKLKQAQTFTRGAPIWSIASDLSHSSLSEQMNTTSFTMLLEEISWQATLERLPQIMHSPWFWLIGFIANFALAALILYQLRHRKFTRHYLRIKTVLIRHIFLLALVLSTSELFIFITLQFNEIKFLVSLIKLFFLYMLSLMLIVLMFKIKKICTFFYWYALHQDFFRNLLFTTVSLYTLVALSRLLAETNIIGPLLAQFNQSVLLLISLGLTGSFITIFCHRHRHFQFLKHHRSFIKHACFLLLSACATIEILGYHTLANHLTYSSLVTFTLVFITIVINQGIQKSYKILSHESPMNIKIIKIFGYKQDESYTEFFILKITLQIIVLAIALFYIAKSWGFTAYYLESIYTQFLNGFHWGNFNIYPARIVAGIMIFCVLYLGFRAIATAIARRQQFGDEEETQVAVASILIYLGFAVAFITGLLIAGFDFTGLAIVAGALSVGIGLGLQSIVNNFVSGLILLIEKPIKPGDRINVDGVEGFVKKIRVRSTQITTPAREDIILPNSDLITRRVTNYMYTDRHLSISCQVSVAYGTNVQLVQELLLKAALTHDEVIKTTRIKPTVLFRSFGENNMEFQIWCLIKDANKKNNVQSDLNFTIERLFREHSIQIAYPQRDIHIKWSEVQSFSNQDDKTSS